MAITKAIFNSLIYGGVDSADYGVYITGDAAFNAPKRSVELVSVPGRNGAIELDQGHFENIEVSYPAGMFGDDQTDFRERLSDFRNAIMSQKGYQRLSDTYHPDEYRMGIYVDGLEVEPKHYNEAGQFTLKFNCKPQRFLTSGEEVITIGEWEDYETVTGDKVTFEADDTTKIKDIKTDINPKQAGDAWSSSPEQAPYLLRRSPQLGHDYFKEFDTLIGGTIAWNQLVQNGNFADSSNWYGAGASVSIANNEATVTLTGGHWNNDLRQLNVPIVSEHKYFLGFDCLGSSPFDNRILFVSDNGGVASPSIQLTSSYQRKEFVLNSTKNDYSFIRITCSGDGSAQSGQYYKIRRFALIDLTAFNFEIADYVYSLEQSTAGSGVAWLKEHFPKLFEEYHAYEPGSLVSVKTSEHRTVGFNQWGANIENGYLSNSGSIIADATSLVDANYISVVEGATMYAKCPSGTSAKICHYDSAKAFLSYQSIINNTFVVPSGTAYIRASVYNYGATFNNDICVNISDASKNGTYEPYESHSYPLGNDDLRGIFKLSNGNLYADGDVKTSDGKIQRKYGIVDLGTLNWGKNENYGEFRANYAGNNIPAGKAQDSNTKSNIICTKLQAEATSRTYRGQYTGISITRLYFSVGDSEGIYADATAFKAAMNGVYCVYELATPTTENADSFTNMQDVSPDGTEEYVDTRSVPVPVGHRTTYSAVYHISPYFDIDIYHSPTPDSADATEYEIDTGTAGWVYGGVLDVTAGKLLVTDKNINYYDGETLPSTWISDRDQYAPGTTPSIGAQVVYKIANPEEHDVDPTQIDALIGSNYVWSNSGDVTVEYGWNPNIIANPTLFDARPLLMVEGYGNIEMNGKDIELKRVVIGNVSIAGSETKQFGTSITMEIGFNPEQFNAGDSISVNPFVFASDYYYELHGDELTLYTATDQLQGAQTTFQKEGTSYYKIQTAWPALTFYVGTDAEYTNEAIITGEAGGQGFLNQRLHTKVELSHRSSTYAVIKFTFNSGSMYEDLYVIATERKLILNGINGDSTLLTLGHPTYIDCDLGEAYMIKNGAVISLNAYIDLGSDLPSLGPGLNRIDFDDTITELKLRPDWWKV